MGHLACLWLASCMGAVVTSASLSRLFTVFMVRVCRSHAHDRSAWCAVAGVVPCTSRGCSRLLPTLGSHLLLAD
eukprot:4145953-Alexandrium_andersonii.AAC.1